MAAPSPDPAMDLVPIKQEEETAENDAPAQEPKLLTKKDISLKEFIGKMDDYAPIVRLKSFSLSHFLSSNPCL